MRQRVHDSSRNYRRARPKSAWDSHTRFSVEPTPSWFTSEGRSSQADSRDGQNATAASPEPSHLRKFPKFRRPGETRRGLMENLLSLVDNGVTQSQPRGSNQKDVPWPRHAGGHQPGSGIYGGQESASPGFIVPAKEHLEKLTIMVGETDLQKGKKKKEREILREKGKLKSCQRIHSILYFCLINIY